MTPLVTCTASSYPLTTGPFSRKHFISAGVEIFEDIELGRLDKVPNLDFNRAASTLRSKFTFWFPVICQRLLNGPAPVRLIVFSKKRRTYLIGLLDYFSASRLPRLQLTIATYVGMFSPTAPPLGTMIENLWQRQRCTQNRIYKQCN
jgi:hypothetical protein